MTRTDEFDPRKFLKPEMDAMDKVCRSRFEAFDSAGHASRIKVVPMSEMAKLYAQGTLDPRIDTAKFQLKPIGENARL